METVNYYYDWSEGGELVTLCRACARQRGAEAVRWASRGHEQAECQDCDAANDPAYSAHIDTLVARHAH